LTIELYENLGFIKNPFSTFSAEEEKDFINETFVSPLYLKSLTEEICSGHSRFILGSRGVGKTSLIYNLKQHCDKKNIFSVTVDDYEGIVLNKSKIGLLRLIIEVLIRDYTIALAKNPAFIKGLSADKKEKLAFIIKILYKPLTKIEYEEHYNRVTSFKRKNLLKQLYNKLFNKPINILISGGIEIISDTIRSSLGLPDPNVGKFYKSYLPELDIERPLQDREDKKLLSNDKALKNILDDLCKIITDSGFKKPVIFFDKIDEYPILSSNISQISSFVEDLLKDTTILLHQNYAFVFSLWDAVKPELTSKGVRFDKIKPLDVTWTEAQLKEILEKRLKYFSEGKVNCKALIANEQKFNEIISMASNSPRYMFRLLSVIYDQQNNIDHTSSNLSELAISNGMIEFSKTFDFYAAFPGKRGTKDDVMTSVNRLLKIGKLQISTKDFVSSFKVSSQTAKNYIQIQQNYGLVVKNSTSIDGNANFYDVKYPVIKHLIENGIFEIAA